MASLRQALREAVFDDVASFVADVRIRDVTPHVAQKVRWSAIDGRTTRHAGYHISQRKRKLVEQVFGWMKTVGGLRTLRHRGVALVDWQLTFAAAAYNIGPAAEAGGDVSLIAGRACRRPPDRGQRIAVRTVVGRSLLA